MKLLIITQKIDRDDPVLGFFHTWIAEFAKSCEDVTAIGLSVGAYDLPKNVKVFSLGKESDASRLKYFWNFYRLIISTRKQYDAVFVHMNPEYVILGGIPWKMMGKVVGLWYAHKNVDWRLRVATRGADIIFTASPESFRLNTPKLNIVGHGIEAERLGGIRREASGEFRIVSIGRISGSKGYTTLLGALELLKTKSLRIKATIVGAPLTKADETYAVSLNNEIARRGLSEIATIADAVPNREIPHFLARADLFVNMSKTGSLDKAVLEAMAAGVPILTSNEGLRSVLLGLEKTCMFKEDNEEDFAAHIDAMIKMTDAERAALGEQLKKIVCESHDLKTLVPKILDTYALLCK